MFVEVQVFVEVWEVVLIGVFQIEWDGGGGVGILEVIGVFFGFYGVQVDVVIDFVVVD